MSVRSSTYREPPTPSGLEKIEKGTLDYMEIEVWSNLNTGVLEEYFEEKNHREAFDRSQFVWKKIFFGILLGSLFAIITEYVGLKVGIAVSGGWYIMSLVGMIMRWNPAEINIASSACNGATYISTGFIFTFPAMYLLWKQDRYALGIDPLTGEKLTLISSIPGNMVVMALIATILTGMLGILYFIILRRIWLVEDPLHVPSWETYLQLIDIANDLYKSGGERSAQAKHSINLVATWIAITAGFTFLRDFPVSDKGAVLDMAFESPWYSAGTIEIPYEAQKYTSIGFGFIPIQIGLGWFMKFKVALLVNLGTFFTWWVIVPLAVSANTPVFDPLTASFYSLSAFPIAGATEGMLADSSAYSAFYNIARPIAVGAILGGGITGLLKMAPTFKSAFADIKTAGKGGENGSTGGYIEGKGWFDWPASHIKAIMILTLISIPLLFSFGGLPLLPSIIFAIILVGSTFFLGAIAVKVMGETGTEPVSGTSFIVLLLLVLLFVGMGLSPTHVAIMALLGTTLFAGSISMSGDIIMDFKTGHYIGNRPYHIVKAVLTAIIPGAIASVLGAIMFSTLLAEGKMDLAAPQANAFAMMTRALVGGETLAMIGGYIMIGIVIGVLAEFTTGMGTAFGLGMYFPLWLFLPMVVGGLMRDVWEKKRLEPMVKAENMGEKEKTMKVLDTYMIATGLIIGEAVMGTVVAMYYMFS